MTNISLIEKKIDSLFEELHRDRIAEIMAGKKQFDNAITFQDKDLRNNSIINAIQNLTTGLEKTALELRENIKSAPDTTTKLTDYINPLDNKLKNAEKYMNLARESFLASLIGIRTLAQCYSTIGEQRAAQNSVYHYLNLLDECDIDMAIEKSRLLDVTDHFPPQFIWEEFIRIKPDIDKKLEMLNFSLDVVDYDIDIEFKPNEILSENF